MRIIRPISALVRRKSLMNTTKLMLMLCVLGTLIAGQIAVAEIPSTLSYQGVLKQTDGTIVPDGDYTIMFRIYEQPSGGTPLWTESQTLSVTGGIFDAILGSATTLDLDFDMPYWLGVAIDSAAELVPRIELTANAYAFRAAVADSVTGLAGYADDDWEIAGNNIYRLEGRVGIGTASPTRTLHVREDVNGYMGIRIENQNTGSASREALTFDNESGSLAGICMYDDSGVFPNGMVIYNNRSGGEMRLNTGGLARLNLSAAGQLGIGTVTPTERLDVNGTVKATGFMLTTAPTAGYVLTSDASGVGSWQEATGGGGFSLPYAGSINYGGTAFSITNTGMGSASLFECDNASNNNASVYARHGGIGVAVYGRQTGMGRAGVFWSISPSNTSTALQTRHWGSGPALSAEASGTGLAGEFIGDVEVEGMVDVAGETTTVVHAEYTGAVVTDAIAVHGVSITESGGGYGVGGKFEGGSRGLEAYAYPPAGATDFYYGILAYAEGGESYNTGISGWASGGGYNYGVFGKASGTGVNVAALFDGDTEVTGTLSKGGGSFKIDHPLDPENKYLYHSFVESPDMMNVYNGNVILDAAGSAWVQMPDWFEALNVEFRYQLTCVGGFAPVYIAEEISDNRFRIAGGTTNLKVSWQVTGIRHDPFAEQNRIPVEEDKPAQARGKYLHPDAYGRSESAGVHYELGQQGQNR